MLALHYYESSKFDSFGPSFFSHSYCCRRNLSKQHLSPDASTTLLKVALALKRSLHSKSNLKSEFPLTRALLKKVSTSFPRPEACPLRPLLFSASAIYGTPRRAE